MRKGLNTVQDSLPRGVDRRQVLKGGLALGAGLVIGFRLPRKAAAFAGMDAAAEGEFVANAFLRIAPDDTVTVLSKHIEFGQGSYTGLATILAEELDADWSKVRVESAPADISNYANLAFGAQGTGGSTAMANSWEQMRRAGATGRALLVAAAAEIWSVSAAEIEVREGVVRHAASDRSARFGELVGRAAALSQTAPPKPEEVQLKDPKDFTLIGREGLPRVDVRAKSRGTAKFTADISLPGMLTAVIERPPRFGAKVASVDAKAAEDVPGVVSVLLLPQKGVVILAEGFWAAKKGRDALSGKVQWDESEAETRSSSEIQSEYRTLLDQPGLEARLDGDPGGALQGATAVLSVDYHFPYLAHAPMEPLDCVIHWTGDGCDVWAGSQLQTVDQAVIAGTLGLEPAQVRLRTEFGGGSFGRRATPNGDVAGEAAAVAKAAAETAAKGRPIKLVWTREDDIRGGRYRPLTVHRLEAGIDSNGQIIAWTHRIVSQSIMKGTPFAALIQNGIDSTSVEGARSLPYDIPNLRVDLHTTEVGVPVLWWRSVGHTHNGFVTEHFLDEVTALAGEFGDRARLDPVEMRRELLQGHPRHLGVLDLAVEKAGWGKALPAGRAQGVAVHESFGSFAAQVVEVELGDNDMPVVKRVVCAIDCGMPINPDVIRAQMESGIGYGLGAALHSEITLDGGRVKESNFHNYRSLRIHEMPEVEVHIVPSGENPTGVGEPGLPPLAPAVANAVYALTGRPVHTLPFRNLSGS